MKQFIMRLLGLTPNRFHPMVLINGSPSIGNNVYMGAFSEIYAKGAKVIIGDNCDIASFVAINCADSHNRTIGLAKDVEKKDIVIGDNVFIGTMSAILGGTFIGHHSVIGAGVILKNIEIPPYSLVTGQVGGQLKEGYYLPKLTIQPN